MKSGSIKAFLSVFIMVFSWIFFNPGTSIAQTISPGEETVVVSDTTDEAADTLAPSGPVRKKDKRPRNATIMSALVPGLGQIYNKRYWKLPILYGLGGVLGYVIVTQNSLYKQFKLAYEDTINLQKSTTSYIRRTGPEYKDYLLYDSPERLKNNRDISRRNRDFNGILLLGLYVLNILDAAVDAHLRSFDVSDNLVLQLDPKFNAGINNSLAPGISLNFKFKNNVVRKN